MEERATFTWLKALPALRGAIAADGLRGVTELRDAVRAHPLQGFEMELVGRMLRDVNVQAVAGHPIIRVAVLASHTSEPLENAARVALLRAGFLATVYEAPFASYRQEILNNASGFYVFRPDLVLIAPSLGDSNAVPEGPMDEAAVRERLPREVEVWRQLWDRLATRVGKPVLQHVAEAPSEHFSGVAERRALWTASRFVEELNRQLLEAAPGFVRWVDVDRLAAQVGRQNWRDPRLFHHGRYTFATRFLPEYESLLSAAVRTALGTAKKALIVDLDNTLWGGVIGDDRLEGIRLGPETAEGAAYHAFCRYVKALGQRGVILGICSKNEPSIAAEVFDHHPHMPLKLDDFAAVACNWNDKATNLAALARELNIDLSSLVFVDDNPAECELIRQALPQVQTVQMSGDPALFIRQLDQLHLFDAQAFSGEDLKRADSYRARSQAKALADEAPDIDSYLASLGMTAILKNADEGDLARLAQMEMKTNQFNLASRRCTMDQLAAMIAAPDTVVLTAALADRFADHGLVSYVAATMVAGSLVITDWLMSCRVFSRTLEQLLFNNLVEFASERRLHRIEARFTPTAKNVVIEGLLEGLGFSCIPGGTRPEGPWEYLITPNRAPMKSFIAATSPNILHNTSR